MQLIRWVVTMWWMGVVVSAGVARAEVPTQQTIRVEVTHVEGTELSGLVAYTNWLGEQNQAILVDDGTAPDLVAEDELWTGQWTGAPVRMLPIRLEATCGKGRQSEVQEVYAGVELIPAGDALLSFAINKDCAAPAIRVPAGQETPLEANHLLMALHALWLALGLGLVVLLSVRRQPHAAVEDTPSGPLWPWLLFWVALAVAWTWPAALAGSEMWVGRHFDLPGTIWSLSAIPRLDWQLSDALTGWPQGADYSRFDSYTLLPIGMVLQFLHPATLHGWLQIAGVALSAWAAQGFARAMGARAPWDLLSGIVFAFSGVAATALLEGHVYVLFNPWMPVFAWAWWLALTSKQTFRQGLLAGLCFSLAVLTTAYLGLAAAVIAICFFVGALFRHGQRVVRPALAACVPVVPIGLALMWVTAAGDQGLHDTTMASIQLGSANMLNLMGPMPQIDFEGHSIAPVLSPVTIGLMLLAPLVMRDWRRVRVLWWTALLALLLSFGLSIDADGNSPLLPLPLFWILQVFETRWYRFPVRMIWTWALCGGVIASLALTQLAVGRRWLASLVVLASLVHAFVAVRPQVRQQTHLAQAPSAYSQVDGPILDLFPEGSDLAREEEMWFSALACAYQVEHGRPLAENCVSTVPQDNPRNVMGRVVRAQLLAGEVVFIREMLSSIGFAAIAFHVDLFSRGDAQRIGVALHQFGDPIADTTDGGEHILLFPVPSNTESQDLFQSQRVAMYEAANDSHFTTNFTIGAVLAEVDVEVASDREVRIEVREEIMEAREIARWVATVSWDEGEEDLIFVDPHEVIREEEDLEFRWVASWRGPIPAAFDLHVKGINREGDLHTEWEGKVVSKVDSDRVVFAYGIKGLHPIVPTEALNTLRRDTDAGLMASMFWGLFLFACTWMWLGVRWWVRRQEADSTEE